MSSSRSVAAARARRANDTSQPTFKSQNMQQQQQTRINNNNTNMKPYQPNENSVDKKLSVSDAFALVTIRLGRVELLLQKWQSMGVETENGVHIPAASTNSTDIANTTIVKSLVSRIDDLEKNLKGFSPMKDIEAKIAMLTEKNMQLQNELRDAKDTIFKLQSMTIDTSQKIMNMMIEKSRPDIVSAPLTIDIPHDNQENNDDVDDTSSEQLESDNAENQQSGDDSSSQNITLEVVS